MNFGKNKKRLVVGASKPWEVNKLLQELDLSHLQYDIFTVHAYKDFFSKSNTHTFGIRSPWDFLKILNALKTLYKKYDEVIIVSIFPYGLVFRMIVLFSLLCAKENVFLWYRGKVEKKNLLQIIFDQSIVITNVIIIPIMVILPLCISFYQTFKKQNVK